MSAVAAKIKSIPLIPLMSPSAKNNLISPPPMLSRLYANLPTSAIAVISPNPMSPPKSWAFHEPWKGIKPIAVMQSSITS